jgi:hypothetical protein
VRKSSSRPCSREQARECRKVKTQSGLGCTRKSETFASRKARLPAGTSLATFPARQSGSQSRRTESIRLYPACLIHSSTESMVHRVSPSHEGLETGTSTSGNCQEAIE